METILKFLNSTFTLALIVPILVSMLGLIFEYWVINPLTAKSKKALSTKEAHGEKLARLVDNLTRTSKEVDSILAEIAQTTRDRETTITKLESEINKLEISEKEYKERIEALKNVPIPAIDYLVKQLEPGEKKSARRDYLLFLAGVIASAVVTIIFKLFGIGS